jgi:hypothetical protein
MSSENQRKILETSHLNVTRQTGITAEVASPDVVRPITSNEGQARSGQEILRPLLDYLQCEIPEGGPVPWQRIVRRCLLSTTFPPNTDAHPHH